MILEAFFPTKEENPCFILFFPCFYQHLEIMQYCFCQFCNQALEIVCNIIFKKQGSILK